MKSKKKRNRKPVTRSNYYFSSDGNCIKTDFSQVYESASDATPVVFSLFDLTDLVRGNSVDENILHNQPGRVLCSIPFTTPPIEALGYCESSWDDPVNYGRTLTVGWSKHW